ncbi:hypothetical protein EN780_02200 [Mesorhizobium sp. M4B.F.Ca.ET.089.01.1.1]|uniref:hypothetical protein n=1 Tax=Mesorhizobium sp. M4B.F.Ca.ET.089.01.1.1 TaxID=2496662 RepID=UPI000FE3B041|nr:hypothetical protein [Mesorhizobium sp. M4B.F.Ca.ET.089.01.1.1]RWX70829.1 hypothetical protein EN780_02200 [Mesorhizobium sp. M4B.F.Ca.ET.089.01.1.1]
MVFVVAWKGLIVDRKGIRPRLGLSMKCSAGFDGSRWLAVCLALLMAFTTILSSHANLTAAPLGVQWAAEHNHDSAAIRHDGHAPCKDFGHARQQGTCGISASNCSFCVPVDVHLFVAISGSHPVATAPPFVSSPSDVPIRLRPPNLVVTA